MRLPEDADKQIQPLFAPELLQVIEARAEPKNSWEGYAAILHYLQAATQRVPTMLDVIDIDQLFMAEIHYLAVLLNDLFAEEGFDELASYLYHPTS